LVAGAGVAGLGLGHALWPTAASTAASAQGSTNPPASSGNAGSGTFPGYPGSFGGSSPFGSGGTGSSGGSGNGSGSANGGSSSGGGSTAETAAIAAKVSPALVDINSTFSYQSAQGAGTGIVLTANGEVLTNNHVINGATKISVTDVGNGKTYNATVVGYDSSHDVAVLQLQGASGLPTAQLANSSSAAVGQSVVAIGNAGGTGGTPSSAGGSITAVNQSITAGDQLDGTSEQLSGLIQVNADIQAGDSGGSLVNTAGQVIGMDTAASSSFSIQTSGTEGFAIPINQAETIVQQIESGQGSATAHVGPSAFLGVLLASSGSSQNGSGFGGGGFGGSSGSSGSGLTISSVVSGGAADQAGLGAGDVITSLDGQAVDSASTLSGLMVSHHPGDKVQIGWTDASGQSHTTTVVLGSGPPA
jgi:S1-C subfamily serine protease